MHEKEIQVLRRQEIDDHKWNNCIQADKHGLIYSYTWFLDSVADDWMGLVYKDYENVMAFPTRKKWGFSYVYKPVFVGQLGVFGNKFQPSLLINFLNAVPSYIKVVDYPLNQVTDLSSTVFSTKKEVNYILPLQSSHSDLKKQYRENTVRNIEKNKDHGQVIKLGDCEETIRMALDQFSGYSKEIISGINKYRKLNDQCPAENKSITYGYITKAGALLSSTSVMRSNGRIYYLLAATTEEGKKLGASHKVADSIIADFAGTDTLFDFEGSNIPGIAFFYEGFGATTEYYQQIHLNRLPFFLKIFKS